jgi:integrase
MPNPITIEDLAALLPRPIPWTDFLAEVLPALSRPVCTLAHEKKVIQVVREIEALDPPPATTADLTVALVSRYVAACPSEWSPYTLKSHLQILQTLSGLAFARRYLTVSPFTTVRMARWVRLSPPEGKRHLTREEISRLKAVLLEDIATRKGWSKWKSRRLYLVFSLGIYCGLRRNELLSLEVNDVDLLGRVIRLNPHGPTGRFKSKGSAKPVGIPDALAPLIEEWLSHRLSVPAGFGIPASVPWLIPTCSRKGPWLHGSHGSKALQRLKAAGRRAGIEHITLHMLRRSLATHLEGHGLGGAMISRIMRHSGQQVTETYYRRADEKQVAEAVRTLEF